MNIADALRQSAERYPDRPAIEDGSQTITFRLLDEQVEAMTAGLQDTGVQRGDLVGLMLTDSIDHLVLIFAIARLGARMISFASGMPIPEVRSTLGSLTLQLAVTQDGDPHLGDVRTLSLASLGMTAADSPRIEVRPAPGDNALFIYEQSSGTTGVPKLIPANHTQYDWWGHLHVKHLGWIQEDRYYALISLQFAFGRLLAVTALRHGLTVVLESSKTPRPVVSAIQRKRITLCYLTPAHLRAFFKLAEPSQVLFPHLRRLVCSTSPLSPRDRQTARDTITPNFYETFGTNETGTLAVAAPADHIAAPETVGRIIESVDAEIIDQQARPVAPGEVGLIRFRNPVLPIEYSSNAEATAKHYRDGWFYPGDLACLDQDGRLFLKGRADDVINNQGTKFYPAEIENVMMAHPAIAEIAVIGWRTESLGEVPVGFVVLRDKTVTTDELFQFCLANLSSYKVPRRILLLQELPRNAMGKVVKRQLAVILKERDAATKGQAS